MGVDGQEAEGGAGGVHAQLGAFGHGAILAHNGPVTTAETDAERIARRYPRPAVPRWAWIPLAVALALVGGAWLIWTALYGANPAVSGRVSSFDVVSDHQVNVTLTVQRPDPSVPAVCTVIAQAVSYETVGQLPVEVAPSGRELQDITVELKTLKRATSASLESCTVVRQGR